MKRAYVNEAEMARLRETAVAHFSGCQIPSGQRMETVTGPDGVDYYLVPDSDPRAGTVEDVPDGISVRVVKQYDVTKDGYVRPLDIEPKHLSLYPPMPARCSSWKVAAIIGIGLLSAFGTGVAIVAVWTHYVVACQ